VAVAAVLVVTVASVGAAGAGGRVGGRGRRGQGSGGRCRPLSRQGAAKRWRTGTDRSGGGARQSPSAGRLGAPNVRPLSCDVPPPAGAPDALSALLSNLASRCLSGLTTAPMSPPPPLPRPSPSPSPPPPPRPSVAACRFAGGGAEGSFRSVPVLTSTAGAATAPPAVEPTCDGRRRRPVREKAPISPPAAACRWHGPPKTAGGGAAATATAAAAALRDRQCHSTDVVRHVSVVDWH